MICPKCGTQNVENPQVCVSCGQVLTAAQPSGTPVQVKNSGPAIASFALGILSIPTLGLTAIPAIILGIIALVAIEKSGGRVTGMTGVPPDFKLIDAWDFGPASESFKHCSFSYHIPFGLYAPKTSGEPGFAVAADRNPWIKSPGSEAKSFALFKPDLTGMGGTSATARQGNAITHQLDGQNVMFLDTHVDFEKRAYCSIEDDNIYTVSRYPDRGDPLGSGIAPPITVPASRKDSVLVHDPGTWGFSTGGSRPTTRTSRD